MLKQIKYAIRENLDQRLIAVIGVIVLNIAFGIVGKIYGEGWQITAVVFSSLALVALFALLIIVDSKIIGNLFTAPAGYTTLLAPVNGWKIILSKIITMMVFDLTSMIIGIIGVVIQSAILSNESLDFRDITINVHESPEAIPILLSILLIILANYFLFITLVFFASAASKSLFYSLKPKKLLGFIGFCVMLYLLTLPDFILMLFTSYTHKGMFFFITVYISTFNPGMIIYLILCVLKAIALFMLTAHMYERRVNI